ncbi:MAG: phosphatase PAP2 family protein [Oscillospiraceae bacterium]|nr:phosphatase PAP2 family protein [Oscillospiraceae bacterium]
MSFLYFLEGLRTPVLNGFFSAITALGGESVFIVLAIVVYWCVSKRDGYYLIAAGVGGTVVNQFLKITCQVPRPWVRDPDFTIVESAREGATGYSFPSGHSQNTAVSFGGIARFTKKTWLRWVCIVIVALVALSRMYLGVHTPADVGVGLAIGLVLVFCLYPLFQRSEEKPRITLIVFGVVSALALGAALFVEFYDWPADIDSENLAEALKNSYTMLGCALGVLVGCPLERKYIKFDTKAPAWAQVLKVALGVAFVMILRVGLKAPLQALFGGHDVAHAVRYFIVVVAAILVWPLTFPWFAKGCPMGKKVKKALKIIGIILLVLVVLVGILYWVVTRDSSAAPEESDGATNPLITSLGTTMLSGHRAGGGIAPENTMMALKNCVESDEYELDIFEFDLHLTADGELVLLHDSTLDRTSDAVEYFGEKNVDVGTKTLAELKNLNMGAQFEADDGTMPYAGLTGDEVPDDLRIITLEETLEYLESAGDYGYIIEIKNSDELGYEAADKLYAILAEYGCLEKTVVGTFHNEVTAYMDENYPDMLRSAGVMECVKFYLCALLNLNVDEDTFGFQALQIPTTDYVINLGTVRVINYAHRYNIAVQYWTIDDPEEMARLQSIGADAVMTNYPDIAAAVLNQP